MSTLPAYKKITDGIQGVQQRLRLQETGTGSKRPRLRILQGARIHDADPELAIERKAPACTADEFAGYVWNEGRLRGIVSRADLLRALVGAALALVRDDQVPTTPESGLARFNRFAPTITPGTVLAAFTGAAADLPGVVSAVVTAGLRLSSPRRPARSHRTARAWGTPRSP